jgi:hypothetical protein
MTPTIVEFTASGTARATAAAIEAYAATRRVVSALVVPWESDAVALRMAVTSMNGDGWAIEHTNLGTISLVDLGGNVIRVAVTASAPAGEDLPDREIRDKQSAVLTAFARQLERKFGLASPATGESRTR